MDQDKRYKKLQKIELIFELLIFGIVLGVVEDIIAVKLVSSEPITWQVIAVIIIIAIPFAIFGEIMVDRLDFIAIYQRIFKKKT